MKIKIFFLVVLLFIGGCIPLPILKSPAPPVADSTEWIHGRWLTISVSDTLADYQMENHNTTVEKHILHFLPEGELKRYSPSRGWVKLRMDYRVEGKTVMMRRHTEEKFFPLAKQLEEERLELLVPKGRYTYVKLDDNLSLEDLAMEGSPEIEVTSPLEELSAPKQP
jgi:hypothetical protein